MQDIKFTGDLRYIKPERLISKNTDDEVADFFLVLGLFFNDLKSLTYHLIQSDNFFVNIERNECSIKNGEYGGLKSHLVRLIAATLFEFIEFIKKNKVVFKTGEFQLLYRRLNNVTKDFWDMIIGIAEGKESASEADIIKIIRFIRHNVAYHYYQSAKVLREGFIDFFYNDEKFSQNESAYFYIGSEMSNTRFFYCDAAAQRSLKNAVENSGQMTVEDYNKKLIEVIEKVNFGIMALMKEYISQRPQK